CARERRGLGDLAPVVVPVGEALARLLPGLAEVGGAPDRGAVPLARSGGVDLAPRRIVDGVKDGPSFAVRAPHRPLAAVVALDEERALAGSDGEQCPGHRCLLASRALSAAYRPPEIDSAAARNSSLGRPRVSERVQPASGLPVSSSVFRPLRTYI